MTDDRGGRGRPLAASSVAGPAGPAGPAKPAGPGQPARVTLSRDQIVDTAIRILDEDGLEALSMRRLAAQLDAGAMSLYWHIRNKDELLDLVVDRVIGEVFGDLGEPQGWRAWMEAFSRSLRRVLLRHRAVAPVVGSRPTFGPNAVHALEDLLGALVADGFDTPSAVLASTTLVNWASAFAVFEVRDPLGPGTSGEARRDHAAELHTFMAGRSPERFPLTIEAAAMGATITPDRQFDYGLDVLLDGIEAQERRRRSG